MRAKTKIVLLGACVALAGCDTMAGLGMDMQNAGSKLENRAEGDQYQPPPPQREPYVEPSQPYSQPAPPGEPTPLNLPPPPPPTPYRGP